MKLWLPFLILLSLGFDSSRASAHAVSNSYLELTQTAERVSGRWRVAAIDLDAAIGLDQDADGRVNDAEVSERRPALGSYLLSRLELSNAERACPLLPGALTTSGRFVVLELASDCTGARSLRYDLFFEHDRSHQAYLHVAGDSELDHVFTSTRRSVSLAANTTAAAAWLQYLGQGIHHILIGADHVLFLLTLLLAAVLRREAGRYEPVSSLRSAFVGVAQIVTAFTAAHSITLTAMALGLVAPPTRWVETAIALSIVAAAANNVWPLITRRLWLVAFGFGLIHGLGFAGVLLELGLPRGQLLAALVGFNLGVEVGQLAIVGVALPLAFWLRKRESRQRVALGFSLSIGAIGLVWSLERALDAQWTTRWASLIEGRPASGGTSAGARPCPGLPALANPALHDVVITTADDDPSALAGRRAYELACAGQLERAAQAYAEAVAAASATTPALGSLFWAYAEVEEARGERRHTEQLLERAEGVWRAQGADKPLADTLARVGELMARDEQWAEVFRLYNEARALHEKAGDTAGLARDLSRLGDVLVSAADTAAAKRRTSSSATAPLPRHSIAIWRSSRAWTRTRRRPRRCIDAPSPCIARVKTSRSSRPTWPRSPAPTWVWVNTTKPGPCTSRPTRSSHDSAAAYRSAGTTISSATSTSCAGSSALPRRCTARHCASASKHTTRPRPPTTGQTSPACNSSWGTPSRRG
jgi:tetratricopeptide (TPR) repeat protein